ncbi:DNA polymerase III subunit beta [Candidatus Daviesbacteria bacterium]|nr:DNA polymerase III subunit beta [Candidatus Daviesbacteria bacterium]
MKFSILQQDFLPTLQAVARSVGVHPTLPVLSNLYLASDGARVKIAATNLEIGVIKLVSAEVLTEGEITVPAKTLVDIVAGLGGAKITIEVVEQLMSVSTGRFRAKISGISASEFPVIPLSPEKGVSFPKEALSSTSTILFAAAADEGRPILTGILTEAKGGILDFVATDGFRLAHRQVKLNDPKTNFKSLIPKRTFEEVIRILGEDLPTGKTDNMEAVEISTAPNQNQAIFKIGQTIVSSRLIEGSFPAWEKIIPSEVVARVIVSRSELLQALKLASVFARPEANMVSLKVHGHGLVLSSEAKELGSQENEIEADVEGKELVVAFNTKFLIDAVSAPSCQKVILEFSGELSPTLLKPVGVEGLEYIIMPVRQS